MRENNIAGYSVAICRVRAARVKEKNSRNCVHKNFHSNELYFFETTLPLVSSKYQS